MSIIDFLEKFNRSFDYVISKYSVEFEHTLIKQKNWLCNLEDKTTLLKKNQERESIEKIITGLKSSTPFDHNDTENLSQFVKNINKIVLIANRINNFKEGTILEDGSKLILYKLFNSLKNSDSLESLDIILNINLSNFLPHLFSIVKHCQNPEKYPIYYRYWKNISREVLNMEDDYDSISKFYRKFPSNDRHLNFGAYFGAIGMHIAESAVLNNIAYGSKDHKKLKKDVLTINPYDIILDKKLMAAEQTNSTNLGKLFEKYLEINNKKGSNKSGSYIRAIELLDNILMRKANKLLEEKNSLYDIHSVETIQNLYHTILLEQKSKNGIFKDEEPSSYWSNGFYSATLKSYGKFLETLNNSQSELLPKEKPNISELIQQEFSLLDFQSNCTSSGLKYSTQLITRYIASLVTKPFVLLSGLSGSGKTKLAQAFAQWICEDKNQYCIVPVGADWTNREPLLGYVNALDSKEYILPENGALELIINANDNPSKPYFLILDEMNLSHVERYFADFLSVMESNDTFKLHSSEAKLNITLEDDGKTKYANAIEVPNKIGWPKNLFVVGTVNIDETTYMFSPKVLDRANVIEFRVEKDDMIKYLANPKSITDLNGEGKTMGISFVDIAKEKATSSTKGLTDALESFFSELQKVGAEFGYRTASEIQTLFGQIDVVNPGFATGKDNEKIDMAIMQKLLPKLHGSRRKLAPVLETLGNLCITSSDVKTRFFESKETIKYKEDATILYPLSLEKIVRMYKSLLDNGFASYAEA